MYYKISYREPAADGSDDALGYVHAESSRSAIRQFVYEQMPTDYISGGWSTRDFYTYSLAAERVAAPPQKVQFNIRHLIWLMLVVGIVLGLVFG